MKKVFFSLPAIILFGSTCLFTQCKTQQKTTNAGTQKNENAGERESGNAAITINPAAPVDEESLQGKWEFDYFTFVNTNKKILFPTQFPYLIFDTKNRKFSGMAGCNNISGSYTQNGDQIKFKEPMVMTRMHCNAMGEKSFVNYLISVNKFTVVENSLQLITDLKPVIVMKRVSTK